MIMTHTEQALYAAMQESEKRFTEKLGSVCEQYEIELTDRL